MAANQAVSAASMMAGTPFDSPSKSSDGSDLSGNPTARGPGGGAGFPMAQQFGMPGDQSQMGGLPQEQRSFSYTYDSPSKQQGQLDASQQPGWGDQSGWGQQQQQQQQYGQQFGAPAAATQP